VLREVRGGRGLGMVGGDGVEDDDEEGTRELFCVIS